MRSFVLLLLTILSVVAHGEVVVTVDDFTSGLVRSPEYRKGTATSNQLTQTGSMVGGSRTVSMAICDPTVQGECASNNPYNQASSFSVSRSATKPHSYRFIDSAGYLVNPRTEVGYGFGTPMSLDFSALGSAGVMRLEFDGLTENLNFNILLYSSDGHWAQNGCNILAATLPFTVELPFSGFITTDGFTFSDVAHIALIFQSGSAIGTVTFGVSSVVASDTPHGSVVVCDLAHP